ncbi:Alpha/Beta hydrolase protein [Delphinella strobiligena]|nr:Alpha/Beta hydrolase protein [Delphinella strobiligena]
MRDGFKSEIRIFKPINPPADGSPLVLLIYGGGFLFGSNKQLSYVARPLSALYGATAVCISYRLAPEHRFPTPQNDTWDMLEWVAKNASTLGADPSKGFILGGVSAGAILTASMAQRALDEKMSPPITGMWLAVPALFAHDRPPPAPYDELWFSREQNAHAYILDQVGLDVVDEYTQVDHRSEAYSPFNRKNPHTGMPPAYIQANGLDPLRDDALIYEKTLRAHGVKTKMDVYPALPHAHWQILPMLKSSVKANIDIVNGLGWLLGKTAGYEDVVKVVAPV